MSLTRKRASSMLAIAALGAMILAGCSSGGGTEGGAEPGGNDGNAAALNCPPEATTPIEGDIEIGTVGSLTGALAANGDAVRAVKATFDYYNEHEGGIETADGKRLVNVHVADDEYTPSVTQTVVRELVEQDNVDFFVGSVGSATNSAVAPYLQTQCIPQLFIAAGVQSILDSDYNDNVNMMVTYKDQARAIGMYLAESTPDATVAVLYMNAEIGTEMLEGLEEGIEGSSVEIVAEQSYEGTDATVQSQMTTLAASGATDFLLGGAGTKCTQAFTSLAEMSWNPRTFITNTCNEANVKEAPAGAGENLYVTSYMHGPGADVPSVEKFREIMEAGGLPADSNSILGYEYSILAMAAFAQAPELTRVAVREAAHTLSGTPPAASLHLDGITLAGQTGRAAIQSYSINKYDEDEGVFVVADDDPIIALVD